jgi:hypothetical protein
LTSFYPKPGAARQNLNNNIAYAGGQASVAGSTFGPSTFLIRVKTNVSGYIKVDGAASISATTNDMMLLATDPPEVFQTIPGGAMAFISTSTSSGSISCQELC